MYCAKTAEPIEMPFAWGRADLGWPKKPCIDDVNIRRIDCQPQGVTSGRCDLLPSYFGHLLINVFLISLYSSLRLNDFS